MNIDFDSKMIEFKINFANFFFRYEIYKELHETDHHLFKSPFIEAHVFKDELEDEDLIMLASEQNSTSHTTVNDTLEAKLQTLKRFHSNFVNHAANENKTFSHNTYAKRLSDKHITPLSPQLFAIYLGISERMFRYFISKTNFLVVINLFIFFL